MNTSTVEKQAKTKDKIWQFDAKMKLSIKKDSIAINNKHKIEYNSVV